MRKAPKRGHGANVSSCPASSCPVGTCDNSPAIHRGVSRRPRITSPVGTTETSSIESSLRDSRRLMVLAAPGINAWAMLSPSLRDERRGDHGPSLHTDDLCPLEARTGRQSLFNPHRQKRWINEDSRILTRCATFMRCGPSGRASRFGAIHPNAGPVRRRHPQPLQTFHPHQPSGRRQQQDQGHQTHRLRIPRPRPLRARSQTGLPRPPVQQLIRRGTYSLRVNP